MNHPLFHRLIKGLRRQGVEGANLFVGVSGGADSVALLHALSEARELLGLKIHGLHCFHGRHPSDHRLNSFRYRAHEFVKDLCSELCLDFVSNFSEELRNENESEASLREFRYKYFQSVLEARGDAPVLVLAHHRDDVFETQLLQMIRGSGPTALSRQAASESQDSNGIYKGRILRPLVRETKADLIEYLRAARVEWIEDPSNQVEDPLRNWLRQSWLPALEEKRPGSLKSFSRSLGLLSDWISDTHQHLPLDLISDEGIQRSGFSVLSWRLKARVIVHYLQQNGVFGQSETQIDEIIKQIDTSRNEHTFTLAGCQWSLCKHRIKVAGPVVP